jgi:hypothetical protein
MHKLSRTSLAAIVCPSAPFLAPRLLRTTVPVIEHAIQCTPPSVQKSCYSTRPGYKSPAARRWSRPDKAQRAAGAGIVSDVAPLLKQLQTACLSRNIDQIVQVYPTLRDLKALGRSDIRLIAQTLHTRIRNKSKQSDLLPFVQEFIADLRSGAVEPHQFAFVHLLGIYKDCQRFEEGKELWQWLVQQDERYVSQAAYGAAIELMAYGGLSSLPEMEDLYVEGVKRFPGTFAEYHLSPDAIIPDRSQPTLMLGIPTLLLQGICTARLLARGWKKAYLAFDTVLRLFPTHTPPRFFELFMIERPVAEAYTAFTVACRAGVSLGYGQFTALITKMKNAMQSTPRLEDRLMILRAAANALYAYQEAGGQLQSIHIGVFVHCFENLLPEQSPNEDYFGERAALRNVIVITAHQVLSGLLQAGFPAQIHPFEALISLAGRYRVPDLLSTTLADIRKAKMDLGPIGTRSALTSAGLVKHTVLIEELWTSIVTKADTEGSQIAVEDWITFTKACRRAGHVEYFNEQLSKLSHTTTSSVEEHLRLQMTFKERGTRHEQLEDMSVLDLTAGMESLKEQMKPVEAVLMSGSPLDLRQSPFHMHLDPSATSLSSLQHLRSVYDEMTTDPHQPPPASSPDKPKSTTGIPLDDLRFMNWLTILEMMDIAEEYESRFQFAMNQAISSGKPFKDTSVGALRRSPRESIAHPKKLGDRIRTLRSPNAIDLPAFRKMSSDVPDDKFKPMTRDPEAGTWNRMKITKHKAAGVSGVRKVEHNSAGAPPRTDDGQAIRKIEQQAPLVGKPVRQLRPVEKLMAQEDVDRYGKGPTLTYYVGLESHHGAPVKNKKIHIARAAEEGVEDIDASVKMSKVRKEPAREDGVKEVEAPWPSVEELTEQKSS